MLRFMLIGLLTCVASSIVNAKALKEPIVIAWQNEPRTFDPRYAVDADSQYLEDLLHCSLVDFSETGAIIPALALSWRWESPTTLSIQLNDKMRFSDGTPVTGEDVKATLEFFYKKHSHFPSPRAGAFKRIKDIRLRPKGLVVHLDAPDATFLSNLSIGILKKGLASRGLIKKGDHPPGCGPYTVASTSVNSIHLNPNPHYKRGQRRQDPHPIMIKIVREETTRFSKLLSGEVDVVQNGINLEKISGFGNKYKGVKLLKRAGLKTTYIGFNMKDPILSKTAVRKAMTHAINKQALIKYIMRGMATSANTLLPPGHEYYNRGLSFPKFDIERANQLLDQAGYPVPKGKKFRFSLTYKTTTSPIRVAVGRAIAADLKKVGILLRVRTQEWGRFKDDVEKGRVQLWGLTWIGFKDPDIYRYAFSSESWPPHGGNRGRFSSGTLDRLLVEARTSLEPKRRLSLYHEVQKIVLNEAPYVFLFHEENVAALSTNVEGFQVYADGRYASLAKAWKRSSKKN